MSETVIFFSGNFYIKEKIREVWKDGKFIIGRYKGEVILLCECGSEFLAEEGLKYLDWMLGRSRLWNDQ